MDLPTKMDAIADASPIASNPQTSSTDHRNNTPLSADLSTAERRWKRNGVIFYSNIALKLAPFPQFRSVVREAQQKVSQLLDDLAIGESEDF